MGWERFVREQFIGCLELFWCQSRHCEFVVGRYDVVLAFLVFVAGAAIVQFIFDFLEEVRLRVGIWLRVVVRIGWRVVFIVIWVEEIGYVVECDTPRRWM